LSAAPYCLAHALAYAAQGWPVLPLKPGSRAPASELVPHGFKDASTDPEVIRRWFEQVPGAGVGIYPGPAGVLVLDVDDKPGAAVSGIYTLDGMEAANSELPPTLRQRTPTGAGQHLVFKLPEGVSIGSNRKFGPEIDVRSGGGYIAAEPTRCGGKAYAFDDWDVLAGEVPELSIAPEWVLEALGVHLDCGEPPRTVQAPQAVQPTTQARETVTPQQVAELRSALNALSADDYGIWISNGIRLAGLGGVGRELWLTWSQQSPKHDPAEAAAKWGTFTPTATGFAAVFKAAAAAGWVNPGSSAATLHSGPPGALPGMYASREDAEAAQAAAAPGAGPFRFVDTDGELHVLAPLVLTDEQRAEQAAQRFPLLTPDELALLPALVWRVRGVLPAQGLAALFGPSGSGKTFLAFDLAAAIAEGAAWFGQRVSAAPVVYAALEGEAGLKQRAQAWRVSRGRALPDTLRVMKEPFRLTEWQDVDGLAASTLRALGPGSVVFIDTLNRAAPTADENSSRDMGEVLQAAKRLQALTGGVVVLVHHTGKDTTRGLRGHSSLFAAMDAAVEVSRDGDRREWRVAKSKDGADGEAHPFTLEVLTLGEDEAGDTVTSCVVTAVTGGAVRAPRLTPTQRASVDSLAAATGQHGELNEDGTLRGVHVESWREVFYSTSTADTPEAKRQAFKRARDVLRNSGLALVLDDFYRPTDAAVSFCAVREIRQRQNEGGGRHGPA